MENHRNSKLPILKSFDAAVSPINAPDSAARRRFRHHPVSPIFYPYASPLMTYLCAAAPTDGGVATGPSSSLFVTPLKVEEDVLVMDGIPVPKTDKGSGARVASNMTSLNLNSTSSQPGGVAIENRDSVKAEFCRRWKDSGKCRFGSECQFAHGKEELCPPCFSDKSKLEIFEPYNSANGSRAAHSRKSSPVNQIIAGSRAAHSRKSSPVNQIIAGSSAAALFLPIAPTPLASTTSTVGINTYSGSINDSEGSNPTLLSSDWSPLDDGFEIILPLGLSVRKNNPSRKELEAEILKVLYDTGSTKRLPVFLYICPN